ncbi:MAG TPA: hypothetical protein ENN34_10960 [Deltaproteobacteria bacterium]|nr:hypothetical protein [Deltaproteobacteria bacterium]
MWIKWLIIPAVIVSLIVLFSDREELPSVLDEAPFLRVASNINLFEYSENGSRSLSISAREIVEQDDRRAVLTDFELSGSNGLHIRGTHARYDFEEALLEIDGTVFIETAEGMKAILDGLSWDRKSNVAYTDNPLRVEGPQGIIEAAGARFHQNFNLIRFSGGVHAKISPDMVRS